MNHGGDSLESYFAEVRAQFPALEQKVYGERLAYLDSAATSLKPKIVVERIRKYYLMESANVHRGAHYLSDIGTRHFEESRETVAKFLNAKGGEEIIFTKGATEGINLVAQSYAGEMLREGDEIVTTEIEHHANIVPWQIVAKKNKLVLKVAKCSADGEIDLGNLNSLFSKKTKLVAITGCSNTLGVRPPLDKIIKMAHQVGAKVLVDASQLILQKQIDVQALDCDFLVFSGHKIFGPTGVGVLYIKKDIMAAMPPYQGGGSMISKVDFPETTYNEGPFRFEAGTPHIEGVIALKTALDFFTDLDIKKIKIWEDQLVAAAQEGLKKISSAELYGQVADKGPIVSFNLKGFHHSDVASLIDHQGVAIRAGHHCTQPLMRRLGITGTLRASFSVYNNHEDVEQLISSVKKAQEMLS